MKVEVPVSDYEVEPVVARNIAAGDEVAIWVVDADDRTPRGRVGAEDLDNLRELVDPVPVA